MTASTDQPDPTEGQSIVLIKVLEDLVRRARVGKERYGTLLMTHNGRDALVDAYQEALDLVMYLKQVLMERDDAKAEEATEDHGDV